MSKGLVDAIAKKTADAIVGCGVDTMRQAIRSAILEYALERIKSAEAGLPVEPDVLRLRNGFFCEPDGSHSPTYGKYVRKDDYDTLRAYAAQKEAELAAQEVQMNAVRYRAEKAEALAEQHIDAIDRASAE